MSELNVQNATIESVSLTSDDHGLLSAWLFLDYGGTGQGFGGYALYLPKSFSHHDVMSVAGHFIFRCMEIAGVTNWKDMPGRTLRVRKDQPGFGGRIEAIGHITKDDWFDPEADFDKARADHPPSTGKKG